MTKPSALEIAKMELRRTENYSTDETTTMVDVSQLRQLCEAVVEAEQAMELYWRADSAFNARKRFTDWLNKHAGEK